jgi:general secretion pathway protein G
MNARRRRRGRYGFTLMEVLLVLAILVILSSLAVVGYQQIRKNMMQSAAKVQIGLYSSAADIYHSDVGMFPTQLQDLVLPPQDIPENKWKGPYLKGELQTDPWGIDYEYSVIQDGFGNDQVQIRSSGPNRVSGDNDDIANI